MKLINLFWFAMISFLLPLFTAFAELMDNALDEVFFYGLLLCCEAWEVELFFSFF